MKELSVYNLEFPDYIDTLDIAGYKFKRTKDYAKAFAGLQHWIDSSGGEFPIKSNTGAHQLTATVEIPLKEKQSILPWLGGNKATRLADVLLFLSLFKGRNIFTLNASEERFPFRPDPRSHIWGGQLRLSMRRDIKWQNKRTREFKTEKEMQNMPVFEYNPLDFGLEQTINEICGAIASQDWRDQYANGHFIFTFLQAVKQDNIEPAFTLCWTIWEHLFTLHNQEWLDNKSIEQMSGEKKIAFILRKYFFININDTVRKGVKRMTIARNRLIHFGLIPENVDLGEMGMFIRSTEQIMAIIFRLQPSNAFNSFEQLKKFLQTK